MTVGFSRGGGNYSTTDRDDVCCTVTRLKNTELHHLNKYTVCEFCFSKNVNKSIWQETAGDSSVFKQCVLLSHKDLSLVPSTYLFLNSSSREI